MADRTPVKATVVSGVATGLAEFAAGDTVPVASGGTGTTTSTGSGSVVLATAPSLTNPTVTTQPASDNSTKAVNTAWAKLGFAIQLATNGYIKLPDWLGGWIFQWGFYAGGVSGAISLAYPLTFPNACRGVWGAVANPGTNTTFSVGVGSLSTSAVNITRTFWNGSTLGGASDGTFWFAVGN